MITLMSDTNQFAPAPVPSASSETHPLHGRGIPTVYSQEAMGGYPGQAPAQRSTAYKPLLYSMPGNKAEQIITDLENFSVEERMEIMPWVKAVNTEGRPLIASVNSMQKNFQVTHGTEFGLETLIAGSFTPEQIPIGFYQGTLVKEGVGSKRFPTDVSNHDISLKYMIMEKYTCFIRGSSTSVQPGDASRIAHSCRDYNVLLVPMCVENDLYDAHSDNSGLSSPRASGGTPASTAASSPVKNNSPLKDSKQSTGSSMRGESVGLCDDMMKIDARQLMASLGVDLQSTDKTVLQALILGVTNSDVRAGDPFLTHYNIDKENGFWGTIETIGQPGPNQRTVHCMCGNFYNLLASQINTEKRFLNKRSLSELDQPEYVSLADVMQNDKTKAHKMGEIISVDPVTCHHRRCRIENNPTPNELARESASKATVAKFLSDQKAKQVADLEEMDFEGKLDRLSEELGPRIILDILGFDLDADLKGKMILEINAQAAPLPNLILQKRELYGVTVHDNPDRIGGKSTYTAGFIPAGVPLGVSIGVLMPLHKVPVSYQTECYLLPSRFEDVPTCLVAVRAKGPLGRFNTAYIPHSCNGQTVSLGFRPHGEDEHTHQLGLGDALYTRLGAILPCLRAQPFGRQFSARDFIVYTTTVDGIEPGSEITENKFPSVLAAPPLFPKAVCFEALSTEIKGAPPTWCAIPCDCNYPNACGKSTYRILNRRIDGVDPLNPRQYGPHTKSYDDKPDKKTLDERKAKIQLMRLSGRTVRDTLPPFGDNPTADAISSMATGELAFDCATFDYSALDYSGDSYYEGAIREEDMEETEVVLPASGRKRQRLLDNDSDEEPEAGKKSQKAVHGRHLVSKTTGKALAPLLGVPEDGAFQSPKVAPRVIVPAVAPTQKGVCPTCSLPVLSTQLRYKHGGAYYHQPCLDKSKADKPSGSEGE